MSVAYSSSLQLGASYSGQTATVTAYVSLAGAQPTTALPAGLTITPGTPWEHPGVPGTYGCSLSLSAPLPLGYRLHVAWSVGGAKLDDLAEPADECLYQLWRDSFAPVEKAVSTHLITRLADDGTTVLTSQAWTDDGVGNETRGTAA